MASTLSQRIIQSRERLRISQRGLARQLEVTHSAVQNWENGNHVPDSMNLAKMADLFNVSTDWLLGRERSADHHECRQYLLREDDQRRLAEIISVAASQMSKINPYASSTNNKSSMSTV